MTKADTKKLLNAIEEGKWSVVKAILRRHPGEVDVYGWHKANCRDKTPLMYAMQCGRFSMAGRLIRLGANVNAKMAGGPKLSVLALTAMFGHGQNPMHENWVGFAKMLIRKGAQPTDALWNALSAYDRDSNRPKMIKLLIRKGADLDHEILAGRIRDLVEINKHRYSDQILSWFGVQR